MRFTKMQGAGNDYVYVNGFEERIEDAPGLARRIADRHFGVGGDGLILIQPPGSGDADCRMEMYNADGSRAQMCGNGIRCVAKYVHDRGIARSSRVRVETDAGLKTLTVRTGADGKVVDVEVDMGPPALTRQAIPMRDGGAPDEAAIRVPIAVDGVSFELTAVSMGNPHVVIRLPAPPGHPPLGELRLAELGPRFERHPWFPERVNTEFIEIRSPRELELRVWERGSGETLACGTGACAAVVAAVINGWCEAEATVHLRGGDLRIRWEGARRAAGRAYPEGGTVYMTGPAVEVFEGIWPES